MTGSTARLMGLAVCVLGGLQPACTRGKAKDPAPSAATSAVKPSAAPVPGGASEDWLQGRLPASVLEGTPVPGGDLTAAVEAEPPSLNVLLDADLLARWITSDRIYEPLITLDVMNPPNYEFEPALAERWEISEDKKTYTFHLRKGVVWHDGAPFTARDVLATFDKITDPTTRAVHVRSVLEELASYTAPDDHTVVMRWKQPYAFTLNTLSGIGIQPAQHIAKLSGTQYNDAAENPLNRKPIGTGPFRFASWESNSRIVLERNDGYWGPKPYLDRLVFRIVSNPTVRLQLAERGEIDVTRGITSEQWKHMDSPTLRSEWNRSRFFGNKYGWIGWNQARPMFADRRVRRALTMLVDRPGIIEKLQYGLPRPTTCHFYWASEQCDPALQPLPYDPDAAMRELDAAGWKDANRDGMREREGTPLRFVLMLPAGSEEAARWAAKVKEDMARAGVAMEIQRVEWTAFSKRLREHNFDACTLLWGSTSPYGDPTQVWHSSSIAGGSNYVSFRNAEADALIERARVEFDTEARNALYRKFGAILHAEQPYTWMYTPPDLDLLHRRVKGARPNLGWWDYETLWIDPALRRK